MGDDRPGRSLTVEEARARRGRHQRSRPASPPSRPVRSETFAAIAEQWLDRHVAARGLRSEREIRRILAVYVLPRWKDRPFRGIKRLDVAELLDQVEDANGARQADYVLAVTRQIAFWFAARDDTISPRSCADDGGRARPPRHASGRSTTTKSAPCGRRPKPPARSASWCAWPPHRPAAREARHLKWDDSPDGVWTIASGPRERPCRRAKIAARRARGDRNPAALRQNPYLFAGARGLGHFCGFTR